MESVISIIIVVASVLLIGVVYIQNPKGGGLSSDFGAAQQIGGVKKTNDFIEKTTWTLAIIVGVLSIFLTIQTKSFSTKSAPVDQQTTTQDGAPAQGGNAQPSTPPAGE